MPGKNNIAAKIEENHSPADRLLKLKVSPYKRKNHFDSVI